MSTRMASVAAIATFLAVMPDAKAHDALRRQTLDSDLRAACLAADLFKLDVGRYPTAAEGLSILLPNGGGHLAPSQMKPTGYLASLPIDPWGRPYAYVAGDTGYRIVTFGADGVPGGVWDDEDVAGCELEQGNHAFKVGPVSVFTGLRYDPGCRRSNCELTETR